MYWITKTFGAGDAALGCCFREWRSAPSRDARLRGAALTISIEFVADTTEAIAYLTGGKFCWLEQWLRAMFSRTTIVANDDPELSRFIELHGAGLIDMRSANEVGLFPFAMMVAEFCRSWLSAADHCPGASVASVSVSSNADHQAVYVPPDRVPLLPGDVKWLTNPKVVRLVDINSLDGLQRAQAAHLAEILCQRDTPPDEYAQRASATANSVRRLTDSIKTAAVKISGTTNTEG